MTSYNHDNEFALILRQLRAPRNLTYPTIFHNRIIEMTAEQRYRLYQRNSGCAIPYELVGRPKSIEEMKFEIISLWDALNSPTYLVPAGMAREEVRKFILSNSI